MSEELKELVEGVIDPQQSRVWLACMKGRRLDVVWSYGEVRTDPYEKLSKLGPYFLMGQHVEESSRNQLVHLFEHHMEDNTYALNE